jgi:Leucine-rich repeat (LRR) protein
MMRWCFIVFFLASLSSYAQLLTAEELDTVHVYTSIREANQNPTGVYALDLTKQKSKEFPRDIFTYTNLNVLILSRNQLRQLPDSIAVLSYLQVLDLSYNKLTALPEGLFALSNMKELDISNNKIAVLSYKIIHFKQLERLSMWGIPIKKLPEQLLDLPHLNYLDVRQIYVTRQDVQNILEKLNGVEVRTSNMCDCGV